MSTILPAIIISCEHAGNRVPESYEGLFSPNELASHRGFDIGALSLAQAFKRPLIQHDVTRLLIDVNRSLHTPTLFSHIFPPEEAERIVQQYYIPHRNRVLRAVERCFQESEQVLHLSVHSFTPELNGVVRDVDIGLLFDPSRPNEKRFCEKLSEYLQQNSSLRICDNKPYLGTADGLTTTLRSLFSDDYMGIEIEVNQKFSKDNIMDVEIQRLLTMGVAYAVQ